MHDSDRLAERFEEHRSRLTAVAYRLLGSQRRGRRRRPGGVASPEPLGPERDREPAGVADHRRVPGVPEHAAGAPLAARGAAGPRRARAGRRAGSGSDPEHEVLLADAVGPALLVVLDTLAPAERVAFVLHDMFAVPFDEIAPIIGRTHGGGPPARQPRPPARARAGREPRRRPAPPGRAGRRVPRRRPRRRLRRPAGRARPRRRAARRPRPRCGRQRAGDPRGNRRRAVLPVRARRQAGRCSTATRRWSWMTGGRAAGRLRLHDQRRADRGHRPHRRSRAVGPSSTWRSWARRASAVDRTARDRRSRAG